MLADKCINVIQSFGNLAKTLVDAVFGNITSLQTKADRCWCFCRLQNELRTLLQPTSMVTEHCAELFNICVNLITVAKNGYKALVALEV